jgi:DNA-binding CsgD family transcriptional regulator
MISTEELRPVERRVLRWADHGLTDAEIAHRFRRSERWVEQVRSFCAIERHGTAARASGGRGLRPLERRLLRWREQGADHEELSTRFRRSPEFLARVEGYAHYKLGR